MTSRCICHQHPQWTSALSRLGSAASPWEGVVACTQQWSDHVEVTHRDLPGVSQTSQGNLLNSKFVSYQEQQGDTQSWAVTSLAAQNILCMSLLLIDSCSVTFSSVGLRTPLSPKVSGFKAWVVMGCYCLLSVILLQEEYDASINNLFFSLSRIHLRSFWYVLHIWSFFIGPQLQFIAKFTIAGVFYRCLLLFLGSFCHSGKSVLFRFCISLADHMLVAYNQRVYSAKLCSPMPNPISTILKASAIILAMYFSILHLLGLDLC